MGYTHYLHAVVVGGATGVEGSLTSLGSGLFTIRKYGQSAGEGEARFRGVALPCHGVTTVQAAVHTRHQSVERQIEEGVVLVVVGHLQICFLIEGVVHETGDSFILMGSANAAGKLTWGVFA